MFTAGRLRLLIALAIITPALLWWGFSGNTLPQKPPVQRDTETSIDFYMRDAQTTYWSATGTPDHQWQTPELKHYPKRAASKLLTPVTSMLQDDGSTYKIRAKEGWVLDDQSEIQLAGDVEVHHNPQTGPAAVLTTSTLTIFPPRDFASTDAPATMLRDGEQTDSTGLEVYFDQRRVELLSNVRGRYNAP